MTYTKALFGSLEFGIFLLFGACDLEFSKVIAPN
jgi:hypothetical protein